MIEPSDSITNVQCDVLVIGGGPAGSAVSALLAERGWHVELLEKDRHPRFHIGESLLPHSLPLLKNLGVLSEVESIGIPKYGAQIVSPYDGRARTLYFSRALDGSQPYAFEVKRAEFDDILFKNCVSKGVHVSEGVRARQIEFRPGQRTLVQAETPEGDLQQWEARFVVDASGRDTFLSGPKGGKVRDRSHNSAAIFGHFEGVTRLPGMDEGNISIVWFDHGWWWIIPFKDGTASVGAVCWPYYIQSRRSDMETFLWDTVALCPPVAERLRHAKLITSVHAAANYSYRRTTMSGNGFLLVGDAFAFIDPVFSSGVHLALNSATLGANVVDAALRGAPEYAALLRHFERTVRRGIDTYSWFIRRFTQPAFRTLFMSQGSVLRMEEAVLSILAGDAFGKSPTRVPIFLFKIVYYLVYLFNFRDNWQAHRNRAKGNSMHVNRVDDYAVK